MIHGVTRPEEVAHLGLSNRLLARIGALLKKKIALSLAVLESAKPGSPFETFLTSAELLQHTATLSSESITPLLAAANLSISLAVGSGEADTRVICLEEELESDSGWQTASSNALVVQQSGSLASRDEPKVTTSPSGAVFSDDHLARTRLKLMTSASAAERIEALRILVVAPLTSAQKGEAILQGLSDADESVRAEAASLLPGLGVSPDVSAALTDLNTGDTSRRLAAADKLERIAASGSNELEDGAVIVCAVSALKGDADRALKVRLLALLSSRAQTVGRNPVRLAELVRVITGQIASAFKTGPSSRELDELLAPAYRLVRELGRHYPADLLPLLKSERERAPDFVTEAFTLTALFELIPADSPDEDALLTVAANYLARDNEEGRDSRAIGTMMVRRGSRALEKLCNFFPDATMAAKRHLLILIDEICRLSSATPHDFERAAQVVLQAMDEGSKALRMAAMECRLTGDPRVSAETRAKLAELFLDSTSDFVFDFDIDKAETGVVRMGAPSIDSLLRRLGSDRPAAERTRAARLIGDLAQQVKPEPGKFPALQKSLTDALRKLEALSLEPKFPDRGEVFVALGKVIASPAASTDANAVVMRTLLDSAAEKDPSLAAHALEGASWLASSRRAQPGFIAETTKILTAALDAPEPENLEAKSVDAAGVTVFEVTGGEHYAESLPSVLKGLERVALAPNCPAGTTREIGTLLLGRWKDILSGNRVWGPANTYTLSQALRGIALSPKCSEDLRLDIVKGLLGRHAQTPIMHAITEILAGDDVPASGGIALGVGFAILSRRDRDGRFDANDRPDILSAITRLAARKYLIAPPSENERTADAFRRTVVNELLKALKDSVPVAARNLEALSGNAALPAELRNDIEKRLAARAELARSRA